MTLDGKMRILLCEDDENLGMLLREYLQAKGYDTVLCSDGEEGYREFLRSKYNLCVFDVMMPKKDGFTLAKEIRMTNSEVPIVFLTAKTLKEDVFEGFKIGADDYLTKPFSMEELKLSCAVCVASAIANAHNIKLALSSSMLKSKPFLKMVKPRSSPPKKANSSVCFALT